MKVRDKLFGIIVCLAIQVSLISAACPIGVLEQLNLQDDLQTEVDGGTTTEFNFADGSVTIDIGHPVLKTLLEAEARAPDSGSGTKIVWKPIIPAFNDHLDDTGEGNIFSGSIDEAVVITPQGGPQYKCLMFVTIDDTNNKPPVFSMSTMEITLPSNWNPEASIEGRLDPGTPALTVSDRDDKSENAEITITGPGIRGVPRKRPEEESKPFVHIYGVELYLDQVTQGTFTVTATDGDNSAVMDVIVTVQVVNIEPPVFESTQYTHRFDVMPGSGDNVPVTTSASDPDSADTTMEYTVEGSDFVDFVGGNLVFTRDVKDLAGTTVDVIVKATEVLTGGKSTDITLTLSFPGESPVFDFGIYTTSFSDWVSAGEEIGLVQATIGSGEDVTYVLAPESSPLVALDGTTGRLTFAEDIDEDTNLGGLTENGVLFFEVVAEVGAEGVNKRTTSAAYIVAFTASRTTGSTPPATTPCDCETPEPTTVCPETPTTPCDCDCTTTSVTECPEPTTTPWDGSTNCPPCESTTCPPPDDTSTCAPCESTTCAPCESTTCPPPEETTTCPPPDGSSTCAPCESTTCPPPDGSSTCAPCESTTCPPPEETTTCPPPDGSSTCAPCESTTCPPPDDSTTCAPCESTTCPPCESTTCPPGGDTCPPCESTTTCSPSPVTTPCPITCPPSTPDPPDPTCPPSNTCPPCNQEGCPEEDCSNAGLVAGIIVTSLLAVAAIGAAGYFFWLLRRADISPWQLRRDSPLLSRSNSIDKAKDSHFIPPPKSEPPTLNPAFNPAPRRISFGDGFGGGASTTPAPMITTEEPGFRNPNFSKDPPATRKASIPRALHTDSPVKSSPVVAPSTSTPTVVPTPATTPEDTQPPKKSNIKSPKEIEPDYEEAPPSRKNSRKKSVTTTPKLERKMSEAKPRVLFAQEDEVYPIEKNSDKGGGDGGTAKNGDSDSDYERL